MTEVIIITCDAYVSDSLIHQCTYTSCLILGRCRCLPAALGESRRRDQSPVLGDEVIVILEFFSNKLYTYFILHDISIRAMKRDLTRHGRRTLGGMLQDGASFAWRYFLGNFRDAERQRGIDIVLGISNKNESTSE